MCSAFKVGSKCLQEGSAPCLALIQSQNAWLQTPTFIPGQGHVQVPVLLATRSACMLCTGCVEALWSQQGVF